MYGSIEIKTAALHLGFLYLQYEVLTLDQMSHYTIEKMFPSLLLLKMTKLYGKTDNCYHQFGLTS